MDSESIVWVQQEFQRAFKLLSEGAPLAEVCRPWSEEEEAAELARSQGAGQPARSTVPAADDATVGADVAKAGPDGEVDAVAAMVMSAQLDDEAGDGAAGNGPEAPP